MTTKEKILLKRLHRAHTFIGSIAAHAKDYGSSYSEEVYYDCKAFLRDNKSPNVFLNSIISTEKLCALRMDSFKLSKLTEATP